jgi:hypothetical protein
MRFDAQKVLVNARQAGTEDLLDRVTVYRAGMEPEAVEIIEDELRRRGVGRDQVEAHADKRQREILPPLPDGTALKCSCCYRPAVVQGWGWHRLWGLLPVFPRYYSYCDQHRPEAAATNPAVSARPPE